MAELSNPQPTTKINVSLSYKLNLGNYQTMDIHVGVEDQPRSGENTNQAFERVYGFLENKLVEKVAAAEEALKSE